MSRGRGFGLTSWSNFLLKGGRTPTAEKEKIGALEEKKKGRTRPLSSKKGGVRGVFTNGGKGGSPPSTGCEKSLREKKKGRSTLIREGRKYIGLNMVGRSRALCGADRGGGRERAENSFWVGGGKRRVPSGMTRRGRETFATGRIRFPAREKKNSFAGDRTDARRLGNSPA